MRLASQSRLRYAATRALNINPKPLVKQKKEARTPVAAAQEAELACLCTLAGAGKTAATGNCW
jgi:hypothetical protein